MQLTDKDIKEYKRIYFEKYWDNISNQEALSQWTVLVNLMKIVLDSSKKED